MTDRPARRLTGRAGLVVLGLALAGGLAGWAVGERLYRAHGLLAALPAGAPNPAFPPCPWRGNPPDVLATTLAASRRVTEAALRHPAWLETGEDAGADAVDAFEARRQIFPMTQTPHVAVTFEHPRPEVALAGVRALLGTAEQLAAALYAEEDADARALVATEREGAATLRASRERLARELEALTSDHGGAAGLSARHQASVERVLLAEQELDRIRAAIRGEAPTAGLAPEALRRVEVTLEKGLESARDEARELGRVRHDVERMQAQAESLDEQLKQGDAMLDSLERQHAGDPCLAVADRGTLPTEPIRDSRPPAAAVGAGAGALLGLLLALRFGRRDA